MCGHPSIVLGLKWKLRVKEHLKKDQACIMVSNDQCSFGILEMFDICPVLDKVNFVVEGLEESSLVFSILPNDVERLVCVENLV